MATKDPVQYNTLSISEPLYGYNLAGHMEMAVFSGFWEGISFYDKWKRHNYGSHLASPIPHLPVSNERGDSAATLRP